MHPPFSLACRLVSGALVVGLSACSTAKKDYAESDGGLLGLLAVGGVVTSSDKDPYAELKEIADSPRARLPEIRADGGGASAFIENKGEFVESPPSDPVAAWKREGIEPRRISIGDIFSGNKGPILNKQVSLADAMPEEQRDDFFDRISSEKIRRVPMTLSQAEIEVLREEADPAKPFPTRSVALDFRTTTRSADVDKLQRLFAGAERGKSSDGFDADKTNKNIAEVKKRLAGGERFFTVVGVTRSDQLNATYPGAPVGSRDAEPIRNAVEVLYPHLGSLEAVKKGDAVEITRDEGIFWEFEARELKLEGEKIVIDEGTLANH